MMTGAFSHNIGKLLSKLKLVTDNLFIYAGPNEKPLIEYLELLPVVINWKTVFIRYMFFPSCV